MKKVGKKLTVRTIALIIIASLLAAVLAAMLIANSFFPVKYLSAYTVSADKNEAGTMRVTFVDVGMGDCAIVELPDGKVALIDGGNGEYKNNRTILRELNSRGVENIDYLVCTTVKREHCGGLAEVVRYKSVKFAYIPACYNTRVTEEYHSLILALNGKNVPTRFSCIGEGFGGEGYFFTFLSPTTAASAGSEYTALNTDPTEKNIETACAVCWLEYGGISFAFCSDARATVFENIVKEYELSALLGEPFRPYAGNSVKLEGCTLVTVSAHGKEECSYTPWYDLLKPEQAILSIGKNYSALPALGVMTNVCNYTQPIYTMYDGSVTVTVRDGNYAVAKEKK